MHGRGSQLQGLPHVKHAAVSQDKMAGVRREGSEERGE